jgi:hypothetical protein
MPIMDVPLCDAIVSLDAKSAPMMGSTDVGDVSWVVPTVQACVATYAIGTPGHSWQLTAQGKTPTVHKGLVHIAKVMACTAVDVLQDDVLLGRAKADHQARVGRMPYVARCRTNWIRRSRCPRRSGRALAPPIAVSEVEHLRGSINTDDETIPHRASVAASTIERSL